VYVRITRGRFDPATEEEVQRVAENQIASVFQRQPGFQRYIGGFNRSDGKLTVVSFWDTEEHAHFSRDILRDAIAILTAIGVTLEPAEVYEATVEI
jgi:hypothetical protein